MNSVIDKLRSYTWKSIWAGDWTYLDCSDWGQYYLTDLQIEGRPFLNRVLFIFKKGKVSAWVDERDLAEFSSHLKRLYADDKTKVEKLAADLKQGTDHALTFISEHIDKYIDLPIYQSYRKSIRDYYYGHVRTKYFFESLDANQVTEYLPLLQPARVYAEPVFTKTVEFDRAMARQISARTGVLPELILCMTRDELLLYFSDTTLPADSVLKDRYDSGAMIFLTPELNIITGADVSIVEDILVPKQAGNELKGASAYPGVVRGKVRIVLDPQSEKEFTSGEILVTKMTRPEYLPFMQMATAIVTDAGGILSHAAISARELKKPCVIGTQNATQVLKTGDLVEVDADHGTVRVL